MDTLLPVFRRELRARAHHLRPVVTIGHHGLTPAVLHEIDVALAAHELIKVRVSSDDRAERELLLARICDGAACVPVQHLGKLLVLWRRRDEPPEAAPPAKARPRKPARHAAPHAAPHTAPRAAPPPRGRSVTGATKAAARGAAAPANPRRRRAAPGSAPAGVG